MLSNFASWCPDGWVDRRAPHATLGMGRLVTTPQQARDDRGRSTPEILAVVDGRFDDLDTLRGALAAAPDASDADLVVAGYRRWGADVVTHLRGEFALLIWDEAASTLFAARDPFGVRPLFYARPGGRFVAASDPEQILATGLVPAEPDDETVVGYLLWQVHDAEPSFFRGIRRLPPGHVLFATPAATRIVDYRRLELVALGDGPDVWAEFRRLFFSAVHRRMESSGPCLLHLSGGLDSSCIVCAADRIRESDPKICSSVLAVAALHPGMASNEETFIKAVEARIRFPVECWDGTDAQAGELDDVPVWAPGARVSWTGGTRGDLDIARRHDARVILNGTGGDQIGIPSGVHQDAIAEHRWADAAGFFFHAPGATVASSLRNVLRLARSIAPTWARELHDGLRGRRERKPAWIAAGAWARRRSKPRSFTPPGMLRTAVQRSHWHELTSARHVLSVEWAQQHGIRSGVEIRFPFMDWDLVRFALSIPSRLWPPPGRTNDFTAPRLPRSCRRSSRGDEARPTPPTSWPTASAGSCRPSRRFSVQVLGLPSPMSTRMRRGERWRPSPTRGHPRSRRPGVCGASPHLSLGYAGFRAILLRRRREALGNGRPRRESEQPAELGCIRGASPHPNREPAGHPCWPWKPALREQCADGIRRRSGAVRRFRQLRSGVTHSRCFGARACSLCAPEGGVGASASGTRSSAAFAAFARPPASRSLARAAASPSQADSLRRCSLS